MRSAKLRQWEKRLKSVLDQLDVLFEDKYGDYFALHPVRKPEGTTANKAHDGLFNITAKFTLGHGSVHGEGYGIELRLVTLEKVDPEFYKKLQLEALEFLAAGVEKEFGGKLDASLDGNNIKIHGDLSL